MRVVVTSFRLLMIYVASMSVVQMLLKPLAVLLQVLNRRSPSQVLIHVLKLFGVGDAVVPTMGEVIGPDAPEYRVSHVCVA